MNTDYTLQPRHNPAASSLTEKLGLRRHLTVTLPVERSLFYSRLKAATVPGNFGLFSGLNELFSSGDHQFVGRVDLNSFKLRHPHRFFEFNQIATVASGSFREEGDLLVVETQVNGFTPQIKLIYGFTIVFYALFAGIFLSTPGLLDITLPLLILHGLFIFGITYFLIRRSVRNMIRNLEREFVFITR